jgi:hypothetical protein
MLGLPVAGMSRSVNAHNVDLSMFCDWLEGSVILDEEDVSHSEVVDVLCDNHVYDDKMFASYFVDNVWRELQRREQWLGKSSLLRIAGRSLKPVHSWISQPAHAFCLSLSLTKCYPGGRVASVRTTRNRDLFSRS